MSNKVVLAFRTGRDKGVTKTGKGFPALVQLWSTEHSSKPFYRPTRIVCQNRAAAPRNDKNSSSWRYRVTTKQAVAKCGQAIVNKLRRKAKKTGKSARKFC